MNTQKKGEGLTKKEKKKKAQTETEVPNPPVPNRAWTEMSTADKTLSDKLKHDRARDKTD